MCLLCCTSIGRGTHEDGIAVLQNQPVHCRGVHSQPGLNTSSIVVDPGFIGFWLIRIRNPGQTFEKGDIFGFLKYFIQHSFICHPSDSIVSEDAGIEPRTSVSDPGSGVFFTPGSGIRER